MIIKTKSILIAALVIITITASPARAEGDPVAGAELGYSCLGCHGIEGYRNAYPSYRVPRLGGQNAAYLVIAIKGYRDGTRSHPTMDAQASSLTNQQIADVAAYLASLADDTGAGGAAAPSIKQTETCIACHGQNGIGLSPTWPTLAGQHEDYLEHALNQYRDGTRTDPVMSQMAVALTDDDVKLLARYYASLEGLQTTEAD